MANESEIKTGAGANVFDQTEIEDALRSFVRECGISTKVYTNRPKVSNPSEDFVVVNVTGRIDDMITYGVCKVLVCLFARDVNEQKNGKKLSVMYKKLAAKLPIEYGKFNLEGTPTIICDSADDYGFHSRIISINTIIKV